MYPTLSKTDIKKIYKPRKGDSNKGTNGHALLVAGSKGKMGAAVIASRACLRTGCGLLTTHIPAAERTILQTALPEAMLQFGAMPVKKLNSFSAVGIGPAMGVDDKAKALLSFIVKNISVPLVIDADAITILSEDPKLVKALPEGTILTPHVKEFDRLFGDHNSIEKRMASAVDLAKKLNLVIVLKNAETLVTCQGKSWLSKTGNSGLAKGGSGDALTGMVLAFLTQGYNPFEAAQIAVYLHGVAADICLKSQSVESMLITDVIEQIGLAFKSL